MKANLSKSQFCRGLQCTKSLWLYRNRKDLIPPTSPEQQMIFDQGHEVGLLAWERFPGGQEIKEDHEHIPEALAATKKALAGEGCVFYEAAFLFDDVLVRPDIMVRGSDNAWDMYEVKSSSKVKDVHLPDVAVQRYVLQNCGIKLRSVSVVCVNSGYVRRGDVDPTEYFLITDVTAETEGMLSEVQARVCQFRAMADQEPEPVVAIGKCCQAPYECEFKHHCWKEVPEYSIFNLTGARIEKKAALWHAGKKTIKDAGNEKLTARQDVQVHVALTGKPVIHKGLIAEFLKLIKPPIYFLDFETLAPVVPLYNGMRPRQNLPFQASIHKILDTGKVGHAEWLGDGKTDPRQALSKFLIDNLGASGTILAYNASFEGGCLKGLGMAETAARLVDLAIPFRKDYYSHPDFKGKWSLKTVLPVLVTGMGYEGMEVGSGTDAQVAYIELAKANDERAEYLRQSLLKYCALDTSGMVHLLKHLQEAVA